jgi:hypothetical protein
MDLETQNAIIAKIAEKAGGRVGPCSVCRAQQFTLADGYVSLSISPTSKAVQIGGPHLPSVALVCTNCGNTFLFNLILLGMQDLVSNSPPVDSDSPDAAGREFRGDPPAIPGL